MSVCDVLADAGSAIVNRREADALRQVLATLEHGPGSGWEATIVGRELGPWSPEEHKRILAVDLWIGTWIRPTLRALVGRYWRPSRTARELAPPVPSTFTARLRETLREGEARQGRADRGGEDPPYWAGFYHSIARQVLEELERREAAEVRS